MCIYMFVGSLMDKRKSKTHGLRPESCFTVMVSWADLIIFCETQFTQVKNEDNNAS